MTGTRTVLLGCVLLAGCGKTQPPANLSALQLMAQSAEARQVTIPINTVGREPEARQAFDRAQRLNMDGISPMLSPTDVTGLERVSPEAAIALYRLDASFRYAMQGWDDQAIREQVELELRSIPKEWSEKEFYARRIDYMRRIGKGDAVITIIDGTPACELTGDRFDDVVRIEQPGADGPGSGIVICSGVVLTCRHVVPNAGIPDRTTVKTGCDTRNSQSIFAKRIVHYSPDRNDDPQRDLALVFIAPESLPVDAKRTWAEMSVINAAGEVNAVGYGATGASGRVNDQIRRVAIGMTITSHDCCCKAGNCPVECVRCVDLVSSSGVHRGDGLVRDICKGDSGGPLLVLVDRVYQLAGITYRNREDDLKGGVCGAGGMFVRLDDPNVRRWLRENLPTPDCRLFD